MRKSNLCIIINRDKYMYFSPLFSNKEGLHNLRLDLIFFLVLISGESNEANNGQAGDNPPGIAGRASHRRRVGFAHLDRPHCHQLARTRRNIPATADALQIILVLKTLLKNIIRL